MKNSNLSDCRPLVPLSGCDCINRITIVFMDRSQDTDELSDIVQSDESYALFKQITSGMIEFSEITADDVISELNSDEDDNCQLGTAKDIISELNSSEHLSDVLTDSMMQFVQNGQENDQLTISLDDQCFLTVRDDVLQEFNHLCDDKFLSFVEEFEQKINGKSERK
ncbi:ATP synthase subunit beta [Trichinella spiralis]|uniref:ATP synthase subunit beta n=1 Tax=Trichinella spiralis TaxID=6334 RepID=A0ABR3L078_TRISP